MLERFRNTMGRIRHMMNAWQESGKMGLYRPKVISRHEYGYRPWLVDCLNAVRTRAVTLGAEELDRVTAVCFWRGYVDATGREFHGDEAKSPTDKVLVDMDLELHETVLDRLKSMGVFEVYNEEKDKLLDHVQQRRQPGAVLVVAFNELWKPAPCASVVQIMKNDLDLDMGEISDVEALRKRNRRLV